MMIKPDQLRVFNKKQRERKNKKGEIGRIQRKRERRCLKHTHTNVHKTRQKKSN